MQPLFRASFANLRNVCALSLFAFVIGAATPASADFLDDLFGAGGGAEAPKAPVARARPHGAAPPRPSFSIRLNEGKREARDRLRLKNTANRGAAPQNVSEAKLVKPVFCYAGPTAAANPASADVRLHDGTLRTGDSVVTASGILVFAGRTACPHKATDFVALSASRLPRSRRDALFALERTLHRAEMEGDASAEKEPEAKVASETR